MKSKARRLREFLEKPRVLKLGEADTIEVYSDSDGYVHLWDNGDKSCIVLEPQEMDDLVEWWKERRK